MHRISVVDVDGDAIIISSISISISSMLVIIIATTISKELVAISIGGRCKLLLYSAKFQNIKSQCTRCASPAPALSARPHPYHVTSPVLQLQL
jgi:hypothetical protein